MRHNEVKTLLRMLPLYFGHMSRNPHCLLTRFYGLYRVSTKHLGRNARKICFIVMGNVFNENVRIDRRYDLKGSTQGRMCKHPEREGINLKDLDLDIQLQLDAGWKAKLQEQLAADCDLLRRCGVMDFSLLLGITFKARGEVRPSRVSTPMRNKLAEAQEAYTQAIQSWNLPEQQALDVESLVHAQLARFQRSRTALQVLGSRHEHARESRDAEIAFHLGEENVRLGFGMSAVAVHKSGKSENVVVHFGIIDFLQSYGFLKKAEHALKAMRYSGKAVSVVNPEFYAARFMKFMESIFV